MIEVNKIRSMKALEGMKKILNEFLNFDTPEMLDVYDKEFGWGEEDLEADRDSAGYLLEQVERRMKSLGHHLAKVGKSASQESSPPEEPEHAESVS